MAAGVYVIRNSHNERVYVGSAQDVSKRWYKHRKDLRAGTHHSRPLQAAWDEIGEGEFSIELVLTVMDVDDLLFYEQCTMDRLNAGQAQGGFNMSNKARAARGYKHSRKRSVAKGGTSAQADTRYWASLRDSRLRREAVSRWLSGTSAGCDRVVPLAGRYAGRA